MATTVKTLTSPTKGEEVAVLWRHVENLVAVVKEQQRELADLRQRQPRRPQLGGAGGGGLNPRGIWNSGTTYATNDLVIVQSGVAAGTYYSTIDENMNDPATGIGWMQIAPGSTVGKWI